MCAVCTRSVYVGSVHRLSLTRVTHLKAITLTVSAANSNVQLIAQVAAS
jgi:hypothetical protein